MLIIILTKIITQILLPPGIFVLLLIISAYYFYKKGIKVAFYINLFFAISIYLLFIEPVQDYFYRELEKELTLEASLRGDVIVLLGGGIYENSPDLSGNSVPSDEALARIVMAYRLHKRLNLSVITTGGILTKADISEAELSKRFLIELGVNEREIILENKSRTTRENAQEVKDILKRYNFKKPILVTTAYHMKRAILNFKLEGIEVIPAPCSFRALNKRDYKLYDYFPGPSNPFKPLKEMLGIIYSDIELFLKQ